MAMAGALEKLSDEELAQRARAGASACYEEIVRRYQVPLARFLARKFPSRRDVEDIVQDALVRAWQSLHRYDSKYAFKTWMFTIAYRLSVSRGRHDAGEARNENLPEHAASKAEGPVEELEREENRSRLWSRAKEVLTEEQFQALWLFYVDELAAGEVAKVMNRSWVSVKTMIHRARRKLEPVLGELAPEQLVGQAKENQDESADWKDGER